MFWATVSVGIRLISWKIMPMPARLASRACARVSGTPPTSIVPALGIVDAVQDLEDRRLAGAVLAEQGVDLAGADVEGDVLEGAHAAETLRDAGHPHSRGRWSLAHRS